MITRQAFSLWRDQRGAVAFEMPFAYLFLILLFLMPLADLATFGFQFISAYAALRDLGQYTQYHDPPDVTNSSSWVSGLPSTGYSISVQIVCGDTDLACSTTNIASPKYYVFSTTITLSPLVLKSVLCSNAACTYTLKYSERFQ